jgi:cytochrome c556
MINVYKSLSVTAAVAFIVLAGSATAESERSIEVVKPMALRDVMNRLGQDMQATTGAISKENWTQVAALAPKIANHAEPPMVEKARILLWLGTDAGKFRGFDEQVHKAAAAMGDAAERGDGQAVITAFAEVQQGCLGCHQSFRRPFVDHFYGSR